MSEQKLTHLEDSVSRLQGDMTEFKNEVNPILKELTKAIYSLVNSVDKGMHQNQSTKEWVEQRDKHLTEKVEDLEKSIERLTIKQDEFMKSANEKLTTIKVEQSLNTEAVSTIKKIFVGVVTAVCVSIVGYFFISK